jgi:hypothetical protein
MSANDPKRTPAGLTFHLYIVSLSRCVWDSVWGGASSSVYSAVRRRCRPGRARKSPSGLETHGFQVKVALSGYARGRSKCPLPGYSRHRSLQRERQLDPKRTLAPLRATGLTAEALATCQIGAPCRQEIAPRLQPCCVLEMPTFQYLNCSKRRRSRQATTFGCPHGGKGV